MREKGLLIAVVLAALWMQGCETLKGTATGFADGLSKDAQTVGKGFERLVKADQWMRENLW